MKMYINGCEYTALSGKKADNINPYDGSVYDTIELGGRGDFEYAALTARNGAAEWSKVPLYDRIKIIYRFVSFLRERASEIVAAMVSEGGKAITEAAAEVDCAANVFEGFAEAARNQFGMTMPLNADPRTQDDILFTIREPLGTVMAVLPYNFPVELYAHKAAPALIMGNAVIVKPASYTPKSAYLLTKLLVEAGVTPGAVNIVTGSGSEFGKWLEETRLIDAVSFTGSTEVGVSLMRSSAKTIRRTYLELGGNDPFVVFDDCDLELAVDEAIGGRLWNAGQTCCASKRFIVHNSVKEAFTARLVEKAAAAKVGDPASFDTVVGPLISVREAAHAREQVDKIAAAGGKIVYGGEVSGALFTPCIMTDITPDMEIAKDMEIFAPVFPIIGFDTFEEAVEIANGTSYGLASAVITQNINTAMKFASSVKAGTCVVNGSGNYRSMQQPFGGYKMSGMGREGTADTLAEFSQQKTIVLKKALV